MDKKKVLFLTGTRADFGKLKALIRKLESSELFEPYIFVTGMHMLSKYGATVDEVRKEKFRNIYTYINQTEAVPMEIVLSNTIEGLSNYINEFRPDMIVVHGDRPEALAGAIVGAMNNIMVAHIEGGELSGTIDELLRHSISKLSHLHFVANDAAGNRLLQMGEQQEHIFVIGSPDIDIMLSNGLPSIREAKDRYEIEFDNYSVFSYHPVTTEIDILRRNVKEVVAALVESKKKYILIYPNNDMGTNIIMEEISVLKDNHNFRMFPSIRFEYYLTFLKNCEFIIGNSSAGIREAEVYNKIAINIGSRQNNRSYGDNIINVPEDRERILKAIEQVKDKKVEFNVQFGDGNSANKFFEILKTGSIWETSIQKYFVDIK